MVKNTSLFWLQAEDALTGVTGGRGSFNTARFAQRHYYGGLDLALSGGESQKLQASDVSGLSVNATAELGNLSKALLGNKGVVKLVNTFSQISLANSSAEDLSRLGLSVNPGSGFFSLDPLVRSEVLNSAENKVASDVHALSGLRVENHAHLFSFLKKDLSGIGVARFSEFSVFDMLSENASVLRSNGFGLGLSARNALLGGAGTSILGSGGLTELALRLKALGGTVA
jgi:hypothetical protein